MRHLTFTLHAGEVLALVGENGAGKTTLVKLLARLYDPDEGRILLDGHDLREYDLGRAAREHRRHLPGLRALPPDRGREHRGRAASRRATTARASRPPPQREPRRRGDRAGCPHGYDQVIGKRFRTGVDLSGGEWQKIAIARAYMRDAQLLILDEPTAALDARAEFEVFQRFKELSEGKTAVLISHRFSSVRMADRILVLADGRDRGRGHARGAAGRRAGATPSCSSCRPPGTGSRPDRAWPQRRASRPERKLSSSATAAR